MGELSPICVGCRIESDGFYGTVRYVGSVSSTAGVWYGVEWDDVGRGKHDGTIDGVRYFETSGGAKCASFLRPVKCRIGIGFMQATLERYGRGGGDEADMYVAGGPKKKQTHVVMVGADKINQLTSQLRLLRNLCLRENYIRGPDANFDKVSCPLPNVTQLDLSLNLLNSWDDVINITSHMPGLQELNVSNNRLRLPSRSSGDHAFESVKVLFLNRMNCTWTDVVELLHQFPSLELLHACYNRITSIDRPITSQRITLLNLEGNYLKDWTHVLALNSLSNLETLILNETGLDRVCFPDGSVQLPTEYFPRLNSLSLNDNKISSWSSVNQLNRLKSLTSLRLTGNPLADEVGAVMAQHLIVAKIGNLRRCNGTVLTAVERRGADLDYLKTFGRAWQAAGGVYRERKKGCDELDGGGVKLKEEFVREHPRYEKLVEKYGAPEDSELKEQQSSALKHSLFTLHFVCPLVPGNLPCSKKIPASMIIQKLKMLVQRLFTIRDLQSIRLAYTSHKLATHSPEISLDNDFREIGYYSIEDQDVIRVYW